MRSSCLKRIILLAVFLSLPVFAQLDENSSFEQYAEACQQGNESACSDGWYNKVTREIGLNESGEPTLTEKFLTKLEEVCNSSSTMMCDAGLNMLSVPLDNANKENAPGMEKANELYNKYTISNCTAIVKSGGKSYFCSGILPKADTKETFKEFTDKCLSAKDNQACEFGLNASKELLKDGEYLDAICADATILNLPVCAERLEWKRNAEAQSAEREAWALKVFGAIGFIAAAFIGLFIYSTRCPSCRKFFALHTIAKDHQGTEFAGTTTKNMKTGEIKDSNYNTVATIHRDVKFNVFKSKFNVKKRCSKCGFTFQYTSTETKNVRA